MKRLTILLLAFCVSVSVYAQSTNASQLTQANTIRNETTPGANTAVRVGNMFTTLVSSKQDVLCYNVSGTDTYTVTVGSGITSYIADQWFVLQFTNANTGAATLNINGLGAKTIKKNVSTDLSSGDIIANGYYIVAYDGTNMQIVGSLSSGGGGTWGSITGTLSSQTDLQTGLDAKSNEALTINTQVSSYTLVLTDKDSKIIEMNSASANNLTVPLNSSVAFPVGTQIPIVQKGAGLTSVVATGGVTINTSSGGLDSPGQNAVMVLMKSGTDEWYLWNGTAGGGGGTVESVSGTADRITVTGTTDPIVDIASTYAGQNTITTLGTVTTGTWNGSDIGYSNIAQGSALSVLGVAGNATADNASIAAGTDNQVLRRSGTSIGFGSVNLASANAVTGVLPIANIATGTPDGTKYVRDDGTLANPSGSAWQTTGTSTLTGSTSIESNTSNQLSFGGSWTAGASLDYHINLGGSITSRNTNGDHLIAYRLAPTLTVNAGAPTSQLLSALYLNPTFTGTASKYVIYQPTTNLNEWFIGGSRLLPSTNGIQLLTAQGYGLTMTTSSAKVDWPLQTFEVFHSGSNANTFRIGQQVSNAATARTFVTFDLTASTTTDHAPTTGTDIQWLLTNTGRASFMPSSGTASWTSFRIGSTINQTGTASGSITYFDINPTRTSVLGTEYGILVRPTAALNGFGTATPTATMHVVGSTKLEGNVTLPTAGNGVLIKEGTNATMGIATLSGGTVVVSTTKVTANSRIFLTVNGGTLTNVGTPYVSARTASTSFTITSTNASDVSDVAWIIIEPAP